MKNRLLICVLTIFVCILCLCSFSQRTEAYVVDETGVLTDKDISEIEDALSLMEKSANVPIRAYICDYHQSYGYADLYDYEMAVGQSFDDIALLVITYEYGTYYYELFLYGEADASVSNNESDRILDNSVVYDSIKSGDIKTGIIEYARLTEKAIVGALRPNLMKVVLISVVIAAVIGIVAALSVFIAYKKKLHSESYPLDRYARLNLRINRDTFITKTVTRVKIQSSSGGGGRSGGGRSGGSRGRR